MSATIQLKRRLASSASVGVIGGLAEGEVVADFKAVPPVLLIGDENGDGVPMGGQTVGGTQFINVDGTDGEVTATAIQTAATNLGLTGGTIWLPAGRLKINAPAASAVNPGEGDCVMLTAIHGPITIRGHGRATVLEPETNMLTLFSLLGCGDFTLRDLDVDGRVHGLGLLQNQVKGSTPLGGNNTGIAGSGNTCYAVVLQLTTASVHIDNVHIYDVNIGVRFRGFDSDNTVLQGNLYANNVRHYGGTQTILIQKPETIMAQNMYSEDIVQSINFDGSNDPGHGLYVSDRSGEPVRQITCTNWSGYRVHSGPFKVNGAKHVNITNFEFLDCDGGVEFRQCEAGNCSDGVITAASQSGFSNNDLLLSSSNRNMSFSNLYLDGRSLESGSVVTIDNDDTADAILFNMNNTYKDIRVIIDDSADGAAPVKVVKQTDSELENIIIENHSPIVGRSQAYFLLNECTRVSVRKPRIKILDVNEYSSIIRMTDGDSQCVDCELVWDDTLVDFIQNERGNLVIGDTNSINALRVENVAHETISFTPTLVPEVLGDYLPTYTRQVGRAERLGDRVKLKMHIDVDVNDYDDLIVAGQVRVMFDALGWTPKWTDFPNWIATVQANDQLTYTAGKQLVGVNNAGQYVKLATQDGGEGLVDLSFPAVIADPTTGLRLDVEMEFEIDRDA